MYEASQSTEWMILSAFVMPVLMAGVLIWFLLSYQKKKYQYENEKKDAILREQALIIENQRAIDSERNRIAGEMHDDIGSGLTIIKYLSDKVLRQLSDKSIQADIEKIADYSTNLVSNMSEIIWAMNSRFDNIEGLVGYIRRYSTEYLEDHNILHSFTAEMTDAQQTISGEKRRNLYLVVKEILHNAVKHSDASKIVINIICQSELNIIILELDGKGFDIESKSKDGNGLYNIQKRMKMIGGTLTMTHKSEGMETWLKLPLEKPTFTPENH
jgi:signal transduction histidine kinase